MSMVATPIIKNIFVILYSFWIAILPSSCTWGIVFVLLYRNIKCCFYYLVIILFVNKGITVLTPFCKPYMMKPTLNPCPMPTISDKICHYKQYYIGDFDEKGRKNGMGENHWEGAESLEWYSGQFLRDTMHGVGEYRSRYRGDKGVFVSYEGHFYANRLHGYGAMSYPDGAVFTGLFYEDIRWGPGVLSQACMREDVGLWRGTQLVRLAWRPSTPNVALDLYSRNEGQGCVNEHRVVLSGRIKALNEVNSAIELLKECGAEPKNATEKWTNIYPKNCTDISSQLCHKKLFEDAYYKGGAHVLEEFNKNKEAGSSISNITPQLIYAWNNNEMMTHMMKHSFQHEYQRTGLLNINLGHVITGPRTKFKQAGKQEIDARTLLMASYLGQVSIVTELVNKCNVHPDIADIQGNTALMYAACGDQVDIIHFLVEAGANINNVNDNCCTPLGVCLLRYACAQKDVPAGNMLQAILPPPAPLILSEINPQEWHMNRTIVPSSNLIPPNKIVVSTAPSAIRQIRVSPETTKVDIGTQKDEEEDSDGAYSEEKKVYLNINTEFSIKIKDLFSVPCSISTIPYFFEIYDMASTVDSEETKPVEKNAKKLASTFKIHNSKGKVRPSQDIMWQNTERDEFGPLASAEKIKIATVSKIKLAIFQLLRDGASPALVRCPQPALFIATVSGCTEMVRYLVNYGADVNEVYPQKFNYTALDLAVSRPLTAETLELVRVLLECGAKADHRLWSNDDLQQLAIDPLLRTSPSSGPNLLHFVLSKSVETSLEEELRDELLELLLDYNCNPMTQFAGRSATDIAMSKSMNVFDIFLKSPQTNLNAAINHNGQSVLVKMFSLSFCRTIPTGERLQTIMNLLLFGADPFLECRNGNKTFPSIFVFAQKVYSAQNVTKPTSASSSPQDMRGKKKEAMEDKKPKKEEKTKMAKKDENESAVFSDYKQTLDLMAGCARLLYVRWIQAKLVRGLLDVVGKFKHRPWNMIMSEHKHRKACELWLTAPRALEIWNILKPRRKKILNDPRVLNHLLCIISFYTLKPKTGFQGKVTAEEKDMIDLKVQNLIKEQNVPGFTEEMGPRPYVMPELTVGNEKKFAVCFECVQPLEEPDITDPPSDIPININCFNCKLVTFCTLNCMKINVEEHFATHPCSEFLKLRYFPTPEESESEVPIIIEHEPKKHK